MAKRGILITLEGIDGSGKSKHARLLSEKLESMGFPVVRTYEPGDTILGRRLRQLLLGDNVEVAPKAELLLYMADRAQHVNDVIIPAMMDGSIVICERYIDSTLVYQGYGRGMDVEFINSLNKWIVEGYIPDLTIVMFVPVEVALERISRRHPDRMERSEIDFFDKLYEGYKRLGSFKHRNIRFIDATGRVEDVQQSVREIVIDYLGEVGYFESR